MTEQLKLLPDTTLLLRALILEQCATHLTPTVLIDRRAAKLLKPAPTARAVVNELEAMRGEGLLRHELIRSESHWVVGSPTGAVEEGK